MIAIFMTYFSGCAFYFFSYEIYNAMEDNYINDELNKPKTWYASYITNKETLYEKVMTTMYFILTILSSVGYGDILPRNSGERFYILCF
jgi:hypothetical protein